ncbi:Zn ribbon containing protein [Methanonatronarchaeum thermophilum]|uniref:Zn ribbon containing protein n=1 Tax=Methanonatronarchaeum thermophilum TaxID=1927129 RepID=A0A1Y3GA40_9EURY|nr:hypothetical protein [Methanonatronarchaeum thermophilum]OUJ18311.1 Zn ribbon containing protein [Methanonatronarchaeum thermophilum]
MNFKWQCERCGKYYYAEPKECSNCGYTVFNQKGTEKKDKRWVCKLCGVIHYKKPSECSHCGNTEFKEEKIKEENSEEKHKENRDRIKQSLKHILFIAIIIGIGIIFILYI